MVEFIVKYWVEVIFSLICGAVAFMVRHHIKLILAEKKEKENELVEKITEKLEDHSISIQQQVKDQFNKINDMVTELEKHSREEDKQIRSEIDIIRKGILSVQGRSFRNECKRLLKENHIITFSEYEAILSEHITYNSLGGNHEGDGLFSMVQAKYQNQQLRQIDNE